VITKPSEPTPDVSPQDREVWAINARVLDALKVVALTLPAPFFRETACVSLVNMKWVVASSG